MQELGSKMLSEFGNSEFPLVLNMTWTYGLQAWTYAKLEQFAIFQSLREQATSNTEIALLLNSNSDQEGCVHQSRDFEIRRAVKQGDSLSALLFNTSLEEVFRRWKRRIGNATRCIRADYERKRF